MFSHLHVHSCFSFLDGGSSVQALVDRAVACGCDALALTDTHGLYGAIRFHRACAAAGIRPIVGVELFLSDEEKEPEEAPRVAPPGNLACFQPGRVAHPHGREQGHPLVLLAADREGFRNLCRVITRAQLLHEKGHAQLHLDTLRQFHGGLFCLSGGERGPLAARWLAGCKGEARRWAAALKEVFGPERFFVEVQNTLQPHSPALMTGLAGLASSLGLRTCATNGVRYAVRRDHRVHDLLTCCRTLTTVDERHPIRSANAEQYLKSPAAMARLFRGHEEALETAAWVAGRCGPSMELGVYRFPDFDLPEGETPYSWLCRLCLEGAQRRYRVLTREVMRRLEHELDVIEKLGFSRYFLVMWDIVRWAREQGIRCAGRGSAADSIVTYVLGITEVDPIAHELLFERFLNPQRKGAPDIDIDFDAARRDEVLDYVYRRYGVRHAAMVCTLNTFHARSAVRDLGKALDYPPEDLDRLAKALPWTGADRIEAAVERLPELRGSDSPGGGLSLPRLKLLLDLCARVAGFPRHLGVHLGGMVVSREPLDELVPLEWATKGVVVTQWDKDDIEDAGLVKMDLLALKNLSAVEWALPAIRARAGQGAQPPWTLDDPGCRFDDPRVYALLRSTRTVGVFQVESPGMRGLLGRLQPEEFEDLIAQISLFRPGPLKADMANPFCARRHGEEPVVYLHPRLEPIMRRTYGVLIYQEQVLQIAAELAGFDYGQADSLRRAMTHDRSPAEMEAIRSTFIKGCLRQPDVTLETAERVWKALSAFAAYGFCKAHAAAFARTAYQTAWLKTYYPAEFFCGILNNQPMGFYSGHTILQEARRLGIEIRPVDVNASLDAYSLEEPGRELKAPEGEAWSQRGRAPSVRRGSNGSSSGAASATASCPMPIPAVPDTSSW